MGSPGQRVYGVFVEGEFHFLVRSVLPCVYQSDAFVMHGDNGQAVLVVFVPGDSHEQVFYIVNDVRLSQISNISLNSPLIEMPDTSIGTGCCKNLSFWR